MTTAIGSTVVNGIPDLDGTIVTGQEALRQRLVQRLAFRLGEWFLDTRLGTESIPGQVNSEQLASQIIRNAIREEGGDELTGAPEFTQSALDSVSRTYWFQVRVPTIYGDLNMAGSQEVGV